MPQAIIGWIATYLGVTATVAAVIYYVAVIAISYGVGQSQARKAKRKARDAYNQSLEDRLVMQATAEGIRTRVYGRIRNVDGIVFKGTHGPHLKFYTFVIALAGHEIDGIETVYFNDVPVDIDSDGWVTTAPYIRFPVIGVTQDLITAGGSAIVTAPFPPVAGSAFAIINPTDAEQTEATVIVAGTTITVLGGQEGQTVRLSYQYIFPDSKARVWQYTGAPGQDLSPLLVSRFPELLSAADKFQGYAALVVEFEFDPDCFPQGVPGVSAVIRGARILDPRTSETEWSENPALIAYDWSLYANGGGCSPDEIVTSAVIAAANACDVITEFQTPDGIEERPLYQCGIGCRLDASPDDWMDEIVESMAGKWAFAGGQILMVAGVFRDPVATLTESWVAFPEGEGADNKEISMVRQSLGELVNVYRPTISDSAQGYVPAPVPEVRGTAYIEEDGEELMRETALSGVTHNVHAQHVCGVFMLDSRQDLMLTIPCNMRAWTIELFDILYVTLPHFEFDGKTFEVLGYKFSPQGGVSLTLKETNPNIYDPAANFDLPDAQDNTSLPSPWEVADVEGVTADSGTAQLILQSDGTITSRVYVEWDPVEDANVISNGHFDVAWLELGGAIDAPWNIVRVAGDQSSVYLLGVPDGKFILIKIRAASTIVNGNWSTQILHKVVGKTEPPPPVEQFKLIEQPGGVRQFFWDYVAAPVDLFAFEAAYSLGATIRPWSELIPLFAKDRNARQTETTDPQNDDVYTFAIRAVDTTGNASYPIYITEVLDGDSFGTVLKIVLPHEERWPGIKTNAFVSGSELENFGTLTWDDLDVPWDSTEETWDNTAASPIIYEHPAVDLGAVLDVTIRTNQLVSGTALVELSTSDDDVTYTAFAPVPTGLVNARYFKFKWTVSGPSPRIFRAQAIFYV